ncbi:MAG TPA: ABC transporter permease [Vicinamibacterales bacterium]|nr:ABC transporter permease [Vicinamibacterales bacterium]
MSWTRRLINTLRRRTLERAIDDELQFHVELRAADLQRAGRSADDARREARRLLGNDLSLRDRTREADVWVGLETAFQDVRYAARVLCRTPLFTIAATLTLAIGIGVNTAMFAVVFGVLIRPLPYADADRLYVLFQTSGRAGRTRVTPLDFIDLQAQVRSLQVAGVVGNGFTFTGRGDPELAIGHLVSGEFFDLLGSKPALGRTFGTADAAHGNSDVIVLSHGFWQRRFGGDPDIVGRTVTANNRPFTVLGVMRPDFSYQGTRYQFWVPLPLRGANPDKLPINRNSRFVQVLAKLNPGISRESAAAELRSIAASLAQASPDTNRNTSFILSSLTEETVGGVRDALNLLFAAVLLVLLIACSNVTSLLLARFTMRRPEVQVRAALGASRRRLIRQFVVETLVLYSVGTAAGMVLAMVLLNLLRTMGPGVLPRISDVGLAVPVLAFTGVTSLCAALVFGILPALQATRRSSWSGVAARTATSDRSHQRVRAAVVIAQIAVALCLLAGASLVGRSLLNLERVDKGFDPEGRLTFDIVMPATRFPDAPGMHAFYARLLESIGTRPEFTGVGTTTAFPLSGQDLENGFAVDGYAAASPDEEPVAALRGVSAGYTAAMAIPIRAGRALTPADDQRGALVALVNETFARRFFRARSPIGGRISVGGPQGPWRTVVGVVADVRHRALATEPRPEVLLPWVQLHPDFLTAWARGISFVVRSDLDLAAAAGLIRSQVRQLDANTPVIELQPVSALVERSVAEPRFRTFLLSSFALTSVCLAAVGIFGVLSYVVSERTREIGIRMALGARQRTIFRDVLAVGGSLVATGSVLGLAGGVVLTQWIRGLLFQVSPTDPVMLAAATLGLIVVGLVATLIPARRATRVNPVIALRG